MDVVANALELKHNERSLSFVWLHSFIQADGSPIQKQHLHWFARRFTSKIEIKSPQTSYSLPNRDYAESYHGLKHIESHNSTDAQAARKKKTQKIQVRRSRSLKSRLRNDFYYYCFSRLFWIVQPRRLRCCCAKNNYIIEMDLRFFARIGWVWIKIYFHFSVGDLAGSFVYSWRVCVCVCT